MDTAHVPEESWPNLLKRCTTNVCYCLLFSIYLFITTKTELWTFTWPPKAVRSLYIFREVHVLNIVSVEKITIKKHLYNCGYALRVAWLVQTAYSATSKSCLVVGNSCSPTLAAGIVWIPQMACITLSHYQRSCLREPKCKRQPQANQSCIELWGNQYC